MAEPAAAAADIANSTVKAKARAIQSGAVAETSEYSSSLSTHLGVSTSSSVQSQQRYRSKYPQQIETQSQNTIELATEAMADGDPEALSHNEASAVVVRPALPHDNATRSTEYHPEDGRAEISALKKDVKALKETSRWCVDATLHLQKKGIHHQNIPDQRAMKRVIDHTDGTFTSIIKRLQADVERGERDRELVTVIKAHLPSMDGRPSIIHPRKLGVLWKSTMDNIRNGTGLQDEIPEYLPTLGSAGYLTCVAEDVASGRIQDDELESRLRHLVKSEHLKSLYSVQTIIGALFLRWLFKSPEAMCRNEHSNLVMKQYDALKTTRRYLPYPESGCILD